MLFRSRAYLQKIMLFREGLSTNTLCYLDKGSSANKSLFRRLPTNKSLFRDGVYLQINHVIKDKGSSTTKSCYLRGGFIKK